MRSEGPPLRDLENMLWIGDIPAHWARLRPERAAVVLADEHRVTTYGQLDAYMHRFVEIMHARGLTAGDRIGYLGRNSDLYFAALFGSIAGGFVLVPLNWRCAAPELAFMMADAKARLVITDAEFEPVLRETLAIDAALKDLVILLTEGVESLRAGLETPPSRRVPVPRDPDQVCVQMYTSGTTGRPKGVLSTHGGYSYARHAELVSKDWANWTGEDVIVSPLPNFHTGGMSWMLIGLVRGLKCVLIADASVAHILDVIEEHSVTRTFIVPTVIRAALDLLSKTGRKPPKLRTITYGAAVMSQPLLREAIDVLGCEFGQYYGMTEATGTVTFLSATDHDLNRPHLLKSVGRPQCGMAVEVRDAMGVVLPANRPGEIWVRTPTLMAGYANLPDAARAAIVDGWYRTGDGGYLDIEGYLYLTDRVRDMIISGGENIYPAEVEAALRQHPAVFEAAVVGTPDEKWGERVVAFVQLRQGAAVEAEVLIAFAAQNIARFKCPKNVRFVEAFPRTPMGKIQRAILRQKAPELLAGTPA